MRHFKHSNVIEIRDGIIPTWDYHMCQCIKVTFSDTCRLWLIQWNPSKLDTLGPNSSVHYSEVSLTEGLCMFLSQMVNTTVLKLYCTVIHNMASLNLLLSKSEIFIKCTLSS